MTADLQRAAKRAASLYPRSKALRNTYLRGAAAALEDKPPAECPYPFTLRNTWRKAYRVAWMRGHRSVGSSPWDDDLDP